MNLEQENEYTIDLGVLLVDFWKGIKKYWYLILILTAIGTAGMVVYQKMSYVPRYAAEATFTVKTTGSGVKNEINTVYSFYYDKDTAQHIGATFPYILGSDIFQSRLKEELNTDYVNGSISVSVIEDSNMVTVKVVSTDREDSWVILDGVMRVYPEIAQHVIGNNTFEIINKSEKSNTPVNRPNYKREGLKGAICGFGLGIALILIYALMRKTIRTEEDMRRIINRPCLALVPEIKDETLLTKCTHREINYRESIYSLQNKIDYDMQKNKQKVLLVTSTIPSEGKTTLALNLAIAMGQRGKKVLLIEGDLRKPELYKRLHIKNTEYSLRDVLMGTVSLNQAAVYMEKESIYYLGSQKRFRNSVTVIQSKKMEQLILQAREFADLVIIDTPPCGMLADAGSFYEYVDSVLMVVKQDWVSEHKVLDAVLDLPECGDKLIGCVLNMVKTGFASYGYGYSSYGYGYGYRKYGLYKGGYYGRRYSQNYKGEGLEEE